MNGELKGLGFALSMGVDRGLGVRTTDPVRPGLAGQEGPPMFWMTMAGPHSQGPDAVETTVTVFQRGAPAAATTWRNTRIATATPIHFTILVCFMVDHLCSV